MNNETLQKYKFHIVLGVILFIFLNYLFYYFRVMFRHDLMTGFNLLFEQPTLLLKAAPLSFNAIDFFVPLLIIGFLAFTISERKKNKKNYRKGVEHGSASWGSFTTDLKNMYDEKNQFNNIIFSQNTRLRLDDKDAPFDARRNKNVCVIGGSGSGKTRFFVKPNLLQMNADFIVTDPKGTIVNEVGMALKNVGKYRIKILNTVNFEKSMRYNPLAYVKKEEDILKLVETIIANTSGNNKDNQDFWVKAEKLLYQAYLSLITTKFPKEEQHLGTLIDLISYSTVKEDDEDAKNAVDILFDKLEEENPESFALKQYKAYKLAAGKTTKSILISCATRLAPLNIPAVRNLLREDELNLDKLGENTKNKTALFVIIPDTDATFNFIVSIMYSQLFNMLCTKADEKYGGGLPVHVRFLLDEFANIGLIPNFDKLIATIRSRNISTSIILQTQSQLKSIYKDNADTIIGNCDTTIFLGGKEKSTVKALSEDLGKQTIDDYNESRTRSNNDSYGQNYSKLSRSLMTEDELQTMERDTCIVQIIGKKPFKDKKYDLTKHPRYKYHSNGEKYWFNIDNYLSAFNNVITKRKRNEKIIKNGLKDVKKIAFVGLDGEHVIYEKEKSA